MKTVRFFSVIVLGSMLLLACGTAKDAKKKNQDVPLTAKIVESYDDYRDGASVRITHVVLVENLLTLSVEYSGGCGDQKHTFELLGSAMLQKSMPPKRGVMLYHNNNGDDCRSLMNDELTFDISALAYEGGEVVLMLEGWDTPIPYTAKN